MKLRTSPSLANGRRELPVTELEKSDRSRFASENSKSWFGHGKFDVPI